MIGPSPSTRSILPHFSLFGRPRGVSPKAVSSKDHPAYLEMPCPLLQLAHTHIQPTSYNVHATYIQRTYAVGVEGVEVMSTPRGPAFPSTVHASQVLHQVVSCAVAGYFPEYLIPGEPLPTFYLPGGGELLSSCDRLPYTRYAIYNALETAAFVQLAIRLGKDYSLALADSSGPLYAVSSMASDFSAPRPPPPPILLPSASYSVGTVHVVLPISSP